MVLQTTAKVCELNCRDRSRYTAILIGVKFVFTGINQNSITIYVTQIVDWFVWLATVVERNRIVPNVLFAFADLLAVVLPVHAIPVKVIIDAVFETRPNRGTRISGRSIDNDRTRRRTPTVIDPVFVSAPPFFVGARDVIAERSCVPEVDRAVELFDVVLRYEEWQGFAWSGIGMNIFGELANVVVLRASRFVGQVKKRDRVWKFFAQERYPTVSLAPRIGAFIESLAWTVERSRDDLVSDSEAWAFVT